MSDTYIFHLYFKNTAHIGSSNPGIGIEGTDSTIIHSDTLWAALCNNWAVAGSVNDFNFDYFLDSFKKGSPLFNISSAFPFTEKKKYWLPKPLLEPYIHSSCSTGSETDYRKALKKIRFVEPENFVNWFNEDLDFDKAENFDEKEISDSVRPHNTLDRISMEARIYHSGTTYFNNKTAGFYFLFRADNSEIRNAVIQLLEIIKHTSGIGGNRSIGSGSIEHIDITPVDSSWDFLSDTNGKNAFCNLSLFHPGNIETCIKNASAYNLVLRKGWTGSLSTGHQVKRQTVYMFSEGSIFTKKPCGHLVDLTPVITPDNIKFPHDIYRYGYAFPVPVRIQGD